MVAYGKYRVDPAYLNQFRNIANNDPWFALGEFVGRGAAAALNERQYQKQLDKAANIEDAMARTSYHDAALDGARNSGLVGTSTYDGITQAKADYNKNKTIYDEAKAKLDAFDGDKEGAEYKNLLELAEQAQIGMNNASANAEMYRQINRNNGRSNEGYYATDSLGEKLGERSLLAPPKQQEQVKQGLLGGVLPTKEKQVGTFTAPTITEMAQKSLDTLQKNPAGIMSAEDLAGYAMTTPSMKETIVANHELAKRSPQYFDNLRREMKKEGVSDEVIDEYIGEQKRNVAYGMMGEYYNLINDGNYLGADALAAQTAFLDPTMAQLLKTGGVSVGNLFGAEQNWLQSLAEAQRKAAEKAETRQYNEEQYEKKRTDKIEDAVKIAELKESRGLSGGSSGSSGGGKASSEETYTKNLVFSASDALDANRIDDAEDFYDKAVTNLNVDITTAKKISAEARAKLRYDLLELEGRILWAKRARGEEIDEERYNEIQRELDELGG